MLAMDADDKSDLLVARMNFDRYSASGNRDGPKTQIPPTLRDLQPTKPNYGNTLYTIGS
jgi:hypothetical protein